MNKNVTITNRTHLWVITAGSTYLDIDAYACIVALSELFRLRGEKVIAYSNAPYNYSVCDFLICDGQIVNSLPCGFDENSARYIIVDVSDPDFLKDSVPLHRITEVFDHHVGFEEYWQCRIGDGARIEFIGAAATLIYREWEKLNLQHRMSRSSALLLMAAILDNTLNLTSSNTTKKDIDVYNKLCEKTGVGEEWRDKYFSEVQTNVEKDFKNALFNDLKRSCGIFALPTNIAQLCVWNSCGILERLPEIRGWFANSDFLLNIIDVKNNCSYFVCDDSYYQKQLEKIFSVGFKDGVAKSDLPYLRKQIIKKCIEFNVSN